MRSNALYEHPEHSVITERMSQKVEVWLEGDLIASTSQAIKVKETGFDEIIYIPKNDIKNIDLVKIGEYVCPFKGHAELYSIYHGDHTIDNAALSYDGPYDQVQELQGRVAFYPDKMQLIKVS